MTLDAYKYHISAKFFLMTCFYTILNVDSHATYSEIKSAYRKKAAKSHPDRGGSHADMVKVNEAWEVLSNSELRKQYDQMLEKGAGVNDQFAEALERAKNYPKSWAKFDQWFNAIGRDFTDANYGSAEFAGISVPTSGNSLTGWLFIFAGGLLGLALAAFLYLTLMPEPQPVRSPNVPTPSKSQAQPNLGSGFVHRIGCCRSMAWASFSWRNGFDHQALVLKDSERSFHRIVSRIDH